MAVSRLRSPRGGLGEGCGCGQVLHDSAVAGGGSWIVIIAFGVHGGDTAIGRCGVRTHLQSLYGL